MQGECKKSKFTCFYCRAAAIFMQKMCKVSAKKANLLVFLPSRSHFYVKSVELEAIFNRCWVLEIQNAASANQSGSFTNQIING